MIKALCHYRDKLKLVGPSRFITGVSARFRTWSYHHGMRDRAYKGQAHTTWGEFCKKHKLDEDYFRLLTNRSLQALEGIAWRCDRSVVCSYADRYTNKCFDFLGSGVRCFDQMPWHCDFRLQSQGRLGDCEFDAQTFYADLSIETGKTEKLSKDIKVAWELSRFGHLPVLACAYAITGDTQYSRAAKDHIVDWIKKNPYLLGINWLCPMEVAIRSINWIVAWQWLKNYFHADLVFYRQFVCSLYDHMRYLENNWEWYDGRTSNHYIADLVGYAYLCWFFKDFPGFSQKWNWCYQELLREFDWQIFDEGTSYEGSTKYHCLVTEFFVHAFIVAKTMGTLFPAKSLSKLQRMIAFTEQCKPTKTADVVSIGDDDSGFLLHKKLFSIDRFHCFLGIDKKEIQSTSYGLHHYSYFGLSIVKTKQWHVTLRHHAYNRRQPSGHFHYDAGSVMLAYNGMPILVDPGSYVYSASSYWRNYFRSVARHNLFYLKNREPIINDNQLFALDIPQAKAHYSGAVETDSLYMSTFHELYPGLQAKREVLVVPDSCTITDQWCGVSDAMNSEQSVWNFTFAPDIHLKYEDNSWLIFYRQRPLLQMIVSSGVHFEKYDTWFAEQYGKKIPTHRLQLIKHLDNEKLIIRFC